MGVAADPGVAGVAAVSLGIVDALDDCALEPSARERVADLAARLMFADPSHDGRSAVAEAVERITVACAGCGVQWLADDPRVAACELCGALCCPACIRWTHEADVPVAMCPACDAEEGGRFHQWEEVVEQKRLEREMEAQFCTEATLGHMSAGKPDADEQLDAVAASICWAMAVVRGGPGPEQLRDVADVLERAMRMVDAVRRTLSGGEGRAASVV